MTVYIDTDFVCHAENDGTMFAHEVPEFEAKCREYIEGHRFVPDGESWKRRDGKEFKGRMISPCKDSAALEAAQSAYEQYLAEATAAYTQGVNSI